MTDNNNDKKRYFITSECIECGICVNVCNVSAIEEGEGQYVINDTCINCGKCKEACPIGAIIGSKG